MIALLAAVVITLQSPSLLAEVDALLTSPSPQPVYVMHTGTDSVGQQLAYETRNAFAGSRLYPLAPDLKSASIVVMLATLSEERRSSTAAAVYILRNNECRTLLNGSVLIVGTKRTESTARDLVAMVDRAVKDGLDEK